MGRSQVGVMQRHPVLCSSSSYLSLLITLRQAHQRRRLDAHSTLMAVMGRMAAYTGKEITWDQAMNSQLKLVPDDLTWDMDFPIRPMARPGRTEFV